MNISTPFSTKKYLILCALPILFDLIISKALEKALFEYDIAFLILALVINITILIMLGNKIIKSRFKSLTALDAVLSVIVFYTFLIIFGKAPSFAELLNI